jgi:ATP-dependent DNA ligase
LVALQIAKLNNDTFQYRGKVGTGFNDATMKKMAKPLKNNTVEKPPKLTGGKIVDKKLRLR